MVLINGVEGIGIGWFCKIFNFDVREVVNNIRWFLDGEEFLFMVSVLGWNCFLLGTVEEIGR